PGRATPGLELLDARERLTQRRVRAAARDPFELLAMAGVRELALELLGDLLGRREPVVQLAQLLLGLAALGRQLLLALAAPSALGLLALLGHAQPPLGVGHPRGQRVALAGRPRQALLQVD